MMSEAAVGLVREGPRDVDDTSFDDFYRSAYPRLHRIALARCGRPALAEELVQETMVKVFARWSKVATYDSPLAYSCRLLVNESIGLRRRQTWEASRAQAPWDRRRCHSPRRGRRVLVARPDPPETADASDRSVLRRGPVDLRHRTNTRGRGGDGAAATLAQARDNLRVQLAREES